MLGTRRVDVWLPGKENSNHLGARPVHQIIPMIKWIWTRKLSINNSLLGTRQVGIYALPISIQTVTRNLKPETRTQGRLVRRSATKSRRSRG